MFQKVLEVPTIIIQTPNKLQEPIRYYEILSKLARWSLFTGRAAGRGNSRSVKSVFPRQAGGVKNRTFVIIFEGKLGFNK